LIHEYKFQGSRRVRPYLYEIFLKGAMRQLDLKDFDVIAPVPLHWWRRFQREFNQAELLAECLSKAWGVPLFSRAAKRVRMTLPQSQLPGKYRELNIRGAFSKGSQSVTGARVLLVDDVMTTGQTLAACSAALVEAGAASVVGYTLARRG
jgi:ComF family protein